MFGMIPYTRNNGWMDLFDEFDRNFFPQEYTRTAAFRTDIKDAGDHYELKADLPGFAKEDIHLQLKDSVLTIAANHDETVENKDQEGRYLCRERRSGNYSRSFNLAGIQEDAITAQYQDGVLTLILPKEGQREPETRHIAIE